MTKQLDLLQRDWCDNAEPIVAERMRGHQFTSDELHEIFIAPENGNWWGVLMARMKNKGMVERIGYQPSRRPEANGRPIAIWKIKSTASA